MVSNTKLYFNIMELEQEITNKQKLSSKKLTPAQYKHGVKCVIMPSAALSTQAGGGESLK